MSSPRRGGARTTVADPNYDGLCGIAYPYKIGGSLWLRCRYSLGHAGEHEWEKHRGHLKLFGGITRKEIFDRAKKGSVAARAILGIPDDCNCTPIPDEEGDIADYLFTPDCPAHSR